MEEDITLLEEMKENCLLKRDYIDVKAERKATAIENILSDYKRVLKENELAKEVLKKQCDIADERNQLLRENQKLQKENEELKESYKILQECYWNECVSKQKIKDKIEELNEYYKKEIYPERFHWADVDITEYYDGMIETLQDLLEEKGE